MKVQKFNSNALVRILNQYKYPHNEYDASIHAERARIVSTRDSWLSGEDLNPKTSYKIYEDGDKVILETLDYKFRISGDLVTKEVRI